MLADWRRGVDVSCEFVHELHSTLEDTACGVNSQLKEPMCVGDGGIDEPPREAWPSSTTLSCD